jgi:hypothetical protein
MCRSSSSRSSVGAREKVRRYYNDEGPTLDTIAVRYATDTYGRNSLGWEDGYAGCITALGDAYDSLYGGSG